MIKLVSVKQICDYKSVSSAPNLVITLSTKLKFKLNNLKCRGARKKGYEHCEERKIDKY